MPNPFMMPCKPQHHQNKKGRVNEKRQVQERSREENPFITAKSNESFPKRNCFSNSESHADSTHCPVPLPPSPPPPSFDELFPSLTPGAKTSSGQSAMNFKLVVQKNAQQSQQQLQQQPQQQSHQQQLQKQSQHQQQSQQQRYNANPFLSNINAMNIRCKNNYNNYNNRNGHGYNDDDDYDSYDEDTDVAYDSAYTSYYKD